MVVYVAYMFQSLPIHVPFAFSYSLDKWIRRFIWRVNPQGLPQTNLPEVMEKEGGNLLILDCIIWPHNQELWPNWGPPNLTVQHWETRPCWRHSVWLLIQMAWSGEIGLFLSFTRIETMSVGLKREYPFTRSIVRWRQTIVMSFQ